MVVTGNTKAGGQGGSLPKRITESAHVIAILVELNDFKSLNPLMCFSKSQSTFSERKRRGREYLVCNPLVNPVYRFTSGMNTSWLFSTCNSKIWLSCQRNFQHNRITIFFPFVLEHKEAISPLTLF